ncbi:extracellular solute-binding protein [Actinacidiphila glaucinigra]|uniref:Carbohydrate ABC transporter substrate-binding protein, CUT1 family n=1 Tax=Actinacidiphila glaucinigra TaxID=235986 RepID=A0A239DYT4_9ACTN|nr:extracellular solute-binding protein [Actinacidiphila glaucinigra]SNS37419.1 carbohydrate ABC transporter substrate-binding protein, CUT1 family [Actinacidiphila glaucinigra]
MKKTVLTVLSAVALTVPLAACGSGGSDSAAGGDAHGPITVWYSNNAQEVAWGKSMVASWNAAHPDEKVKAQEIPAGKSSEEVIGAAITAGNAPCLILNTAPAAVPGFQKQGGLVALDDFPGGKKYLEERTGERLSQYASPDGKHYQMPWKSNPVMIFYNKDLFKKAGLDAEHPKLSTYQDFLTTSRALVEGGVHAAIWPAPTSEFYQSWFDFYPLFAAQTGKQLVEDGKAQFASPDGIKAAEFWKTMYADRLAPNEQYNGDAFADGKSAMAIVGPWAVSVYGDKVKWGAVPVPTATGAEAKGTFSDEKSIGMFTACKNKGTAWDVLKFATSKEQDGKLLEATGQMPMRQGLAAAYPDYFASHPDYKTFAEQADRTVEAPNVPNSVEIWQTFRDAYTKSVIFGKGDVESAFREAAGKVDGLAKQ